MNESRFKACIPLDNEGNKMMDATMVRYPWPGCSTEIETAALRGKWRCMPLPVDTTDCNGETPVETRAVAVDNTPTNNREEIFSTSSDLLTFKEFDHRLKPKIYLNEAAINIYLRW